jgi:hypothetical protein
MNKAASPMAEDRIRWNKQMITKTKLSILAAAVILCITSTAFADKLCLQTTVNRKTFKTTNKSVVAATCPKGFTELADTSRFQGPAGARGIVNLAACGIETRTCNHGPGANECTQNCNQGEFILQQGVSANGNGCNPTTSYQYTALYSNGLGAGTTVYSAGTCNYSVLLNILCCPTS